jgi:hypothetical protein
MIRILSACIFIWVPGLFHSIKAQSFADTAAYYFEELKQVTNANAEFWNKDLYAPLLFVNPATREVFANTTDTTGILQGKGEIFYGVLPKRINISNTSVKWGGQYWAMVMLPVSKTKSNRVNLLVHELFHRAQQGLGFSAYNPDNNHLDKKEARIYLRLELEALQRAVAAAKYPASIKHVKQALVFRQMRRSLFPGADSTENLMELNEGLCEFTGQMMSGRNPEETKEHFRKRITGFISTASYVRSFAYETIPVYGWLLSQTNKKWHRQVNAQTDLTEFFIKSFNITIPSGLRPYTLRKAGKYNGKLISEEETVRDEKIKKQAALYTRLFIDSPHVELPLIKMNMSFDYTRMMPLETSGTVYPQIRITDEWGVLEAENGAMISADWRKAIVSKPVMIEGNTAKGDGWKLELKEGYVLVPSGSGNGYLVKRK